MWEFKGGAICRLHFNEIRDEKKFFKGIPSLRLKRDMVELAGHILDRKAEHFDPQSFMMNTNWPSESS